MNWGTIVRVNLSPVIGSEADKTRPALVVCNDRAVTTAVSLGRGVVSVLPITSNVTRVFPFQVMIDSVDLSACGLDTPSKIQAEQIRSVDVRRISAELGSLPPRLHEPVRRAITLHLALD